MNSFIFFKVVDDKVWLGCAISPGNAGLFLLQKDFPNVCKYLNIGESRIQLSDSAIYSGWILNILTFNNLLLKFSQCNQINLKQTWFRLCLICAVPSCCWPLLLECGTGNPGKILVFLFSYYMDFKFSKCFYVNHDQGSWCKYLFKKGHAMLPFQPSLWYQNPRE